jgi:hypothetical protein
VKTPFRFRGNQQQLEDERRVGLLFLGVVFVFGAVFGIFFFGRLPHDSNYHFLLAFLGVPYAFLMLCVVIGIALCLAPQKDR